MSNFDYIISQFYNGDLQSQDWKFHIHQAGPDQYVAYIMGEGEECLARKDGFSSREQIVAIYRDLGVEQILPI